ncbi:mediator of RNA polymerase II transcription subunit 22-like [Orbicella faveolata]|uniref:mediator of RNA polymerase II transcription subunit 22-like n=1 Tax=Orbicella faveolata TaxID=48498 RepID=UPI0009E3343E|nr:mediator of RNA polymerase II transcription subunit 22-like [Orbicella faveolata]
MAAAAIFQLIGRAGHAGHAEQVMEMSQWEVQDGFLETKVRAGESLMKLVSDMKEFLILNDFPSVNASISERSNTFQEMTNQTDQQLLNLKQELALNLFELEQSYYSSSYR